MTGLATVTVETFAASSAAITPTDDKAASSLKDFIVKVLCKVVLPLILRTFVRCVLKRGEMKRTKDDDADLVL